jgi:hypothetical protein
VDSGRHVNERVGEQARGDYLRTAGRLATARPGVKDLEIEVEFGDARWETPSAEEHQRLVFLVGEVGARMFKEHGGEPIG